MEQLKSVKQKHTALERFTDRLAEDFRFMGVVAVMGKRDEALETARVFDAVKDVRTASLSRIYPLSKALTATEAEGAYTRGLQLVCASDEVLILAEVKGKENRFDVRLLERRDCQGVDLKSLTTVEEIRALPPAYIDDAREQEVLCDIWLLLYREILLAQEQSDLK